MLQHHQRLVILIEVLAASFALAACGLPRDSDGTLDRVRAGSIRVGMVVDTPWVTDSAGGAGGVEAALVRAIAQRVQSTITWVPGQESELLESLHARELDLVIGGLTVASPWGQLVALTRPYYIDTVVVGGAPASAAPESLDHLMVVVRSGDPAAAEVRKKGGRPVPEAHPDSAPGPIAAPTWRLAQLGRTGNLKLQLAQNQHVLAASPGENAWLMRIEQVLASERDRVPSLIRSAGR